MLQARGERVVAVDTGSPAVPDGLEAHLRSDGLAQLQHARAVVKSPGVPRDAPVIEAALERDIPVLGELELGWRLLNNEFIAVTGTNGKTTTVQLLGHIHREAGLPVAVAGNVGDAVSGLVGTVDRGTIVVCETSSFQLEDAVDFAPEGAVLLNMRPDHLDRHGTWTAYERAKQRVFASQAEDDIAVTPVDLWPMSVGRARRLSFGYRGDLDDRDGFLWWDDEPLIAHEEIRLRGVHNRLNAAAASAIALARGIDPEAVVAALRTFAGVEHRLEEVASIDGVLYVNDSKATNVDSTLVALASFESPVHLIIGGVGKGQDFSALRGRAHRAYLIGEVAEQLEHEVGGQRSGDLEHALAAARGAARPGEVVLLSPACASFDQYEDYEARGRAFKALLA